MSYTYTLSDIIVDTIPLDMRLRTTNKILETYDIIASDAKGFRNTCTKHSVVVRKALKYNKKDLVEKKLITIDNNKYTIFRFGGNVNTGPYDGLVIMNLHKNFKETIKGDTIRISFKRSLNTFVKLDTFECVVCYEDKNLGLKCSTCSNSICKECAQQWLSNNPSCAYCRAHMTL